MYKAPRPRPWRLLCHSQDALLRGAGTGQARQASPKPSLGRIRPGRTPRPPLRCSQALLTFAHARLQVARSWLGVGARSLRPGRAEDPGREASPQGQSLPVIKSSARWHHACPLSQLRATAAHPASCPGCWAPGVSPPCTASLCAAPAAHDTLPVLPPTCRRPRPRPLGFRAPIRLSYRLAEHLAPHPQGPAPLPGVPACYPAAFLL